MSDNPTPQQEAAQQAEKTVNKGCAGCVVIILIVLLLGLIGSMCSPDTGSSSSSDSYKAGNQVGFLDGNMARNGGRLKASDDQIDAAARRVTAGVQFNKSEDREDWIRGYKSGYSSGWNAR